MYGENNLNHQSIFMYGLTKDFFNCFGSLKYLGIELPLTMQIPFMQYIRPYVEKKLNNQALVDRFVRKYKLTDMKQVQTLLGQNPPIVKDLGSMKQRTAVLMSGRIAPTAVRALKDQQVILTINSIKDKKSIEGLSIPPHVVLYNLRRVLKKVTIRDQKNEREINRILSDQKKHPVYGAASFKQWLMKQCAVSMKFLYVFDQIIRKYPIGVIVNYTSLLNYGPVQALLAKKYNIPFVQCALELVTDNYMIPSRATHHCVWGKNFADWLIKRGIPASQISIVGNPRFEDDIAKKYLDKKILLKELSIPSNHYIVTFMTQPFPFKNNINMTIIDWMNKTNEKLPITFLIKKHPSDKENYVKHIAGPNIKTVPDHYYLHDILRLTDAVMTISSNSAIEAVMHKKGVIVLQPELPYHYEFNYNDFHAHLAKAAAGFVVNQPKQLNQYVEQLAQNKKTRESLVRLGQKFMKNTMITSPSASALIGKVIKRYLNTASQR